ncbi:Similar to Enolase-phosphatase E1; acc. no. C7Z9X4 [Pyronema omphalodes CBS 100304]|uniref:Similar to Enolase-phosphatase E1 acc. no. C7Z9X4 n=1 Tax=Pyronema omphalodes (strain CBS 100304) TaxID=1076935 RepID=U4LPY2_PYROM|nr:Similar to Enolase-phosphatase E1; acc. no. C7Z9X4 [Pyronema omphalodes CBS 100304]
MRPQLPNRSYMLQRGLRFLNISDLVFKERGWESGGGHVEPERSGAEWVGWSSDMTELHVRWGAVMRWLLGDMMRYATFPYALAALPKYLEEHWDDEDFKPYRDAFPEGHRENKDVLEAYVRELTAKDVKVACLKQLQGVYQNFLRCISFFSSNFSLSPA